MQLTAGKCSLIYLNNRNSLNKYQVNFAILNSNLSKMSRKNNPYDCVAWAKAHSQLLEKCCLDKAIEVYNLNRHIPASQGTEDDARHDEISDPYEQTI